MSKPTATIHLVGAPIVVRDHARQLCAWCGLRLVDVDLSSVATCDGLAYNPFWEQGALLEVGLADANPQYWSIVQPTAEGGIPRPNCAYAELGDLPPALRLVTERASEDWEEKERRK